MLSHRTITPLSLVTLLFLGACVAPGTPLDEAFDETGVEGPFDGIPSGDEKFDEASGRGPRVRAAGPTEVWASTAAWADLDAAAGVSWEANSGLDWEQKFDLWISSFELEDRLYGSGETFVVSTPYGDRSFHAPTLECAELAVFLRVTFASWYHLPFYLQGWHAESRTTIYAGHFGFIDGGGSRIANFPRFRTSYRDYEGTWRPGQPWPSDSLLRRRRLGANDEMPYVARPGETVGAGAYFDEMFLNKRVGHFMRLILLYFGSANLADGANAYHIEPEAIEAGDFLVERWKRRGIGHLKPIFLVEREAADALQVSIASGSMPRREPLWESPNVARSSFLLSQSGGVGDSAEGESYAALGGGVRRWRTAVHRRGRWYADVPRRDREFYIADDDHEAISARPARFDEILRTLTPDEMRDAALEQMDAAREHIWSYPASCAARINRENAFAALYDVMMLEFGWTRAQIDAEYRTLGDYVFAELTYSASRTCCWNRSTSAMNEIIMDYAEAEQLRAEADAVCIAPTVFRAEVNGYERWRNHAVSIGRGSEWRAWSEDESCSQRAVPEDTVATLRGHLDFCDAIAPPEPPVVDGCDPDGGDDDAASASTLYGPMTSKICADDPGDWYRIDSDATVVITFDGSKGDLDLTAYNEDLEVIDASTGIGNGERVTGTGMFYVKVFGYVGAANSYRISRE